MWTWEKIVCCLLLALGLGAGLGFPSGNQTPLTLSHEVLTHMIPHPADPSKLLVASEGTVYIREENRNWKPLLTLQGKARSIRRLIAHPRSPDKIFLLTDEGILEGGLRNAQQKLIFRGRNLVENRSLTLTLHPEDPERLYVGTARGLFLSRDGGKSWHGPSRWPENQRIHFVAFLPSRPPTLLLGMDRELLFSKDGGDSFESGFSLPWFPREDSEERLEEEVEGHAPVARFSSQAFSRKDPSRLWVGTSEGVFESRDGGIEWEKLSERGLEDLKIRDLTFSDRSGLIAATGRGVFRFHPIEKRWENLPVGTTRPAASIALSPHSGNEEVLLVGSDNQVFEWVLKPLEIPYGEASWIPSPDQVELFRKLITLEPSVREIQKAAIRYGDLGNGKIKRWHSGSRLRAFIPRLSFGRKLSLNNNIDIDRGGTSNPDVFIAGPEQVDRGWDLGFTWELGDFLYSSAQSSIDNRAKLLVELRESILSEVTRIYFERRRVQIEMALAGERTFQEKLDLFLRLDELTAQLDALTDGFLSRELEKIDQNEPGLRKLFS